MQQIVTFVRRIEVAMGHGKSAKSLAGKPESPTEFFRRLAQRRRWPAGGAGETDERAGEIDWHREELEGEALSEAGRRH